MVTRPPSLCSERDSIVPRCSMITVNIRIENSTAHAKSQRTARNGCPTVSFAIDVLKIGFDRNVGAELLRAHVAQRREHEFGSDREGNAIIAGDNRVPFAIAPKLMLPPLRDMRTQQFGPDIAIEAYLQD